MEYYLSKTVEVDGAHLNSPHTAQISSLFHSHNVA